MKQFTNSQTIKLFVMVRKALEDMLGRSASEEELALELNTTVAKVKLYTQLVNRLYK